MKDYKNRYQRYIQDPLPVQLGGIAANLARIQSFSDYPGHQEATESLLKESEFFIEWAVPEANLDIQTILVELQLQLAIWYRNWSKIWADTDQLNTVAGQARIWSDRLLKTAGLL